jgi:hypothetical protein
MQLLLHDVPVVAELLQNVAQTSLFGGHRDSLPAKVEKNEKNGRIGPRTIKLEF